MSALQHDHDTKDFENASNTAVSRYLKFITRLGHIQTYIDGFTCASRCRCELVRASPHFFFQLRVSSLSHFNIARWLFSRCFAKHNGWWESRVQSSKMWEICDFSHNRLTLHLQPSLEKASWESFSRRCEIQYRETGALLASMWTHARLCVCTWRLACSALIGWAVFSLPLFYPQVGAWLPIPWAAVLFNLQRMIHNSSPVKLNHSLLWPLINIQWKTQSLSWCASRQICSALSCL